MIQQNINRIKEEIGETSLIAVSKYRSLEELRELHACGQRIMAENRVQELLKKKPELPEDIEWHLIGHLQTNKVKSIIEHTALIHSVDSMKLLHEIEKQAAKKDIVCNVLLQVHVAQEDSKFGFPTTELSELIESGALRQFQHICFKGLMSMASLTVDFDQVRQEFKATKQLFETLKRHMPVPDDFTELSMGMSGDYAIAIEEGATMVRIGSKIFS